MQGRRAKITFKSLRSKLLLSALLILSLPLLAHIYFVPIEFNQFMIQRLETLNGTITLENFTDMLRSSYASGVNYLFNRPPGKTPDYQDKLACFNYLFAWLPTYAIVYPTEGFYYFNAEFTDVGKVSGNLRIADLDQGKISYAYFKVPYQEAMSGEITTADGLSIEKINDYAYSVTYQNKTVFFKIPKTDVSPPEEMQILPEEEFVGQIHDESGVKLFLFYNHQTNSFYEVLNEEAGVTEEFELLAEKLFLGKRTGFVYYQDPDYSRKILIGVHYPNIQENTFFDGPGDQVPYRAELRNKLECAYPSTRLGAGINEHGVLMGRDHWARYVIGPYLTYTYIDELHERLSTCNGQQEKSELWTCLSKEWWYTRAWLERVDQNLEKEQGEEGKLVLDNYFFNGE